MNTQPSVVITGASGGIGQALALRFGREGYRLFLQVHSHEEVLRECLRKADLLEQSEIFRADLSDYRQCEAMCRKILIMDVPQVLINNAGIACFALLQDMDEDDWDRVMNTNVKSVFACTKTILPAMLHRKSGTIINISSMWGIAGSSMEVAYSASKGAVNAFARALGKELAPSGIRVNAIACGVIDTPMNACLSEADRAELAESIPMGRFGRAEEVADLAWYLASEQSSYLTAQVLELDGGYL